MSGQQEHPLKKYTENEKIAYLSVVAVIITADKQVSDDEILKIRNLCKTVDLSPDGIGKIISVAENPKNAPINDYIQNLKKSELKFTLITDMFFIAFADEVLTDDEISTIFNIAKQLNVKDEQVTAIRKYVETLIKLEKSKENAPKIKEVTGDAVAGLAAVGVPVGAVAISGTVFGLSAAGITSGLAALGMGLGMASGIGVVAVIGVASYFGVKWLWKKISD